jgi:STE24 endopeptidase
VLSSTVTALFVFGGGLGAYDAWVARVAPGSFVGSGVVFVAGLLLVSALLEVPFQLYGDFRIEQRHGFNRQTAGLWWSDWLKSTLLSLLLSCALAAGALALVQATPNTWWIWVSALVSGVSLLLTFLSPYVIEPLFHKMEPLEVEGLSDGIRAMTERAGVHIGRVLKVDASRRSSHSNAYFTGLGRVKRVVLFDTLLAQMSQAQILAVLAHELGHWKKHHVLFRMLTMQVLLVAGAYLAFRLVPGGALPQLVGIESASFAARVVILMLTASVVMFPLTPLFAAWSRRDEREADRFAVDLHQNAHDLADALAKLGTENLSNLHPHPLYAAFYYSHPPLTERISSLRAQAT